MLPKEEDKKMFNLIVGYLRETKDFSSPFVEAYKKKTGATDKELRDWVSWFDKKD